MLISLLLLGLATTACAVPAPAAITVSETDDQYERSTYHTISLTDARYLAVELSTLERRQERCDWDSYCHGAWLRCVKSCASINNGDW